MTNEIDWKALFGAYMDYIDTQEGTDYLWLQSYMSTNVVHTFRKHLQNNEQFEAFKAFVKERHEQQDRRRTR